MGYYRVEREVIKATGTQTFFCSAESKEEAFQKLENGEEDSVDEILEIVQLSSLRMIDIIEVN